MSSDNQQPCCSKQLRSISSDSQQPSSSKQVTRRRELQLTEEEVDRLFLLADSDDENETTESDVPVDDDYVEESTETETDEETDEEGDENYWVRYRRRDGNLRHFPFTVQNSGIQISILNRPHNEIGYFQLFFTDELLTEIVNATIMLNRK